MLRDPRPVLITGFDAFGAQRGQPPETNASWRVAQALDGELIEGHRVVAALLPTEFEGATRALDDALRRHRPALVLCLGLAENRTAVSIERVALNIDDARIHDNAGRCPVDTPVATGGPAALFATLPIKAMAESVRHAGVSVEISQTAGTFVCNHVFYRLMHGLAVQAAASHDSPATRGGFIHLPRLESHDAVGTPTVTSLQAIQAIRLCVETALRQAADVRTSGGSIA